MTCTFNLAKQLARRGVLAGTYVYILQPELEGPTGVSN